MLGDRLIAVIDDDEGSRSAVMALLRSLGLQARAYASAASFLAGPEERWACVISDVQMPGVDGFGLLSRLQSASGCPRVVLMSAHPRAGLRERALEAGAVHFLEKPVAGDDVLACLAVAAVGGPPAPDL